MHRDELEHYLHEHIPLSSAMGVCALEVSDAAVTLGAPLAPNINHRDTVFGGSASALAILAAWSLIRVRLDDFAVTPRIVIQRNTIEYDAPILGEFTATARLAEAGEWDKFLRMLERRGRARIRVVAQVVANGIVGARFEGDFVAIDTEFGNRG